MMTGDAYSSFGTTFVSAVLGTLITGLIYLAWNAPKLEDCEPQGGKVVTSNGRKVCLSSEQLKQIREEYDADQNMQSHNRSVPDAGRSSSAGGHSHEHSTSDHVKESK